MSSFLINPYRFGVPYDTDAQAYITAVEAADGQALETAVKDLINTFVVGCKADAIWTAIKACCLMCGARTLAGALVPLVGPAPTNVGFVAGDYNRKTGIVGNGTSKYLNSNRTANADPESNVHIAAYVTTLQTNGTTAFLMGSSSAGGNDAIHFASTSSTNPNSYIFRCRDDSSTAPTRANQTAGLFGLSRSNAINYQSRHAGATVTHTTTASGTNAFSIYIFGGNDAGSLSLPSVARISHYSIGESLNLALLDARAAALVNGLAALSL